MREYEARTSANKVRKSEEKDHRKLAKEALDAQKSENRVKGLDIAAQDAKPVLTLVPSVSQNVVPN